MRACEAARPWIRSPRFDLGLIVGVFALALALGGVAAAHPVLFAWVIVLDLWLLAYPHVASTFTRLALDRASAREHRFLLVGLPPLVFAATASATWLGGAIAVNTIYFVWQSWHYTRQSHGIARAYRRDPLSEAVIHLFPLWGLLHRAAQRPAEFFSSPVWTPALPRALVVGVGALALLAFAAWTLRRLRALRDGDASGTAHALFVLSHVVITTISYLAIADITRGWLFINLWHNAQYLLFVWAFNARRFAGGVEPARPFLSTICQREHALRYALVCLALSTAFYLALGRATALLAWSALPMVLVCHQTVNFHHYLVDAVIWRSRRRVSAGNSGAPPRAGGRTPRA